MPSKIHIHRYVAVHQRKTKANVSSGYRGYYKCADPDCTHTRKAELILGKRSLCNRCNQEFILPIALDMMLARPHCKACTRVYPEKRKVELSTNKLRELFNQQVNEDLELEVED